MVFQKPRLIVAAARGGSGKTVISLGLIAALRKFLGLRVVPFKKGPDYIDAGWLSMAAQHPCYNLDPFLMSPNEILSSFLQRSLKADGSIIEGNRGLYDGMDVEGTCSTAELAKLLKSPVILVLDATKMTRTGAALVLGCQHMDPEVHIAGVVLNHVANKRHEGILRGAIERYCGIPVLGAVPKDKGACIFPERHMGLVPPQEHGRISDAVESAASKMRNYLDLDAVWQLGKGAQPLGCPAPFGCDDGEGTSEVSVRIGVLRDAAFQFYYPENLEALKRKGATLLEISSLEDRALPAMDALYIGGGFPETHVELLANNRIFRESVRCAIEAGLPVYAECGGLMFLCRSISSQDSTFPMVGIFPFDVVLEKKPQGHGYTVLECISDNPFFPKGLTLKAHEFHYSRVAGIEPDSSFPFIFRMQKGQGILAGWDGICYKNALASYSHIHVVGNEHWADAMISAAQQFQRSSPGMCNPKADLKHNVSGVYEYLTAS